MNRDLSFRKANKDDIDAIVLIYERSHDAEEAGFVTTGWLRGVYPVRTTAEAALQRGDLFVMEENNTIYGSALINRIQVDVYADAPWKYPVSDDKVCVLHTLVISPKVFGRGFGKQFVRFYEEYALDNELPELRLDTNASNAKARAMYAKLGYDEIAVVPTVFNGIPDVNLVLLEKNIEA